MNQARRIVVKFGGSVLQDDRLLETICKEMAAIQKTGFEIVVVHGGGPAINEELRLRNIEWSFVEGLRVTTPEMMSVIEAVLSGRVNKRIVRALQAAQVNAVGISGVDGGSLQCEQADPRLGRVGSIRSIQTHLIESVLNLKSATPALPVLAPIGIGPNGDAFNINADWAAAKITTALEVRTLIFLTDQDGILDENRRRIAELDSERIQTLIETGVVRDGMLAKARTILHALDNGVQDVHVVNARSEGPLGQVLRGQVVNGTSCHLTSNNHFSLEPISV